MTDEQFWQAEERFWLDADVYDTMLDAQCLMVFPGLGLMQGAQAIRDSLRNAPRWSGVAMSERIVVRAGEQVVVLGYRAEGRRGDAEPYVAWCSSTYRRDGARWLLVQHQHTPA